MSFNQFENLFLGRAIDMLNAQGQNLGIIGEDERRYLGGQWTYMVVKPGMYLENQHVNRLTVQQSPGVPDPNFDPVPYLDVIPPGVGFPAQAVDMDTYLNDRGHHPFFPPFTEPTWDELGESAQLRYGLPFPVDKLHAMYDLLLEASPHAPEEPEHTEARAVLSGSVG